MAQHWLIYKCNNNCYICVIGKVKDYYGVHETISLLTFDQLALAMKSHIIFWR